MKDQSGCDVMQACLLQQPKAQEMEKLQQC
jgi:hypothetical protein